LNTLIISTKNVVLKQKHVETLGYLDELEKLYPDPIVHFREIARKRTEEELHNTEPIQMSFDPAARIMDKEIGLKNLGYIVFEQQSQFFETLAPSLESVYRSLDYFDRFNLDLQAWLNDKIKKQYGRDQQLAYYDVTNYYFEIDAEDEFRRRGPSKEHRPNPIVQMGLLLDSQGLPLAYHLFPGNQSEKLSLNPLLNHIKDNYGLSRLVIVADKGLNCGDNIASQIACGNGYVYSQSICGTDKEFKQFVLDQHGYRANGEYSKCKSRIYPCYNL